MTSEKELWESKYEQKRKALKEVESTLGKKVIELERINNVQENQLLKEKAQKKLEKHSIFKMTSLLRKRLRLEKRINGAWKIFKISKKKFLRLKFLT